MNKYIMAAKLTAGAVKVDKVNPQKVVSEIIRGLQDSVKVMEMYVNVCKAVGRFYKALSENGKLRSAAIVIIREGKNILRDVLLRVRDNAELMEAIKTVSNEIEDQNKHLDLDINKSVKDLEDSLGL